VSVFSYPRRLQTPKAIDAHTLKRAGATVPGMLPAALLAQLGMPAPAAAVFLAVATLAVVCRIIGSDARTGRVARMMLARAW
jgi:hypothetical protein